MKIDQTKLFYDQNADSYAKTTLDLSVEPLWELLTNRLDRGALILDLGCGAGRDIKYFTDHGYQVIGVDFSKNLVEIARAYSKQRVDLTDFRSLSYPDNTFDAVWAIASLLHISRDELSEVLAQIHRILKPSGIFVTSMKKGTDERIDEKGRFFADYLPSEWNMLLQKSGFKNIEIQENEEPRISPKDGVISLTWIVSISSCDK